MIYSIKNLFPFYYSIILKFKWKNFLYNKKMFIFFNINKQKIKRIKRKKKLT